MVTIPPWQMVHLPPMAKLLHEAYVETIHGYSFLEAIGIAPAAQTADGYFQADGERMADGLRPGYSFFHADGTLLADGSTDRDRLMMHGRVVSFKDSFSSRQLADGNHLADGSLIASGNRPLDGIPEIDYGFSHSEVCTPAEFFHTDRQKLVFKDAGGTARLYYADGRFMAGPEEDTKAYPITANGDCFANGTYLAYGEAYYLATSNYTLGKPLKIANGFYRADGEEMAGPVPLYGRAGDAGEKTMLLCDAGGREEFLTLDEQTGVASEACESITAEEVMTTAEPRMAIHEGRGYSDHIALADGTLAANGKATAGRDYDLHEAYVENIHGYSFLENLHPVHAADGTLLADGMVQADSGSEYESLALRGKVGTFSESLSLEQLADGNHLANASLIASGNRPLDDIPEVSHGLATRENCSLIEAFYEGRQNHAFREVASTARCYAEGKITADGSICATGFFGCLEEAVIDWPASSEEYLPLAESLNIAEGTAEAVECSEDVAVDEARLVFREGRCLDGSRVIPLADGTLPANGRRNAGKAEGTLLADGASSADGTKTAGTDLAQTDYSGLEVVQKLADGMMLSEGLALNIGIICQEQLRGTHHYWCDGSYLADGNTVPHIPITEALAV